MNCKKIDKGPKCNELIHFSSFYFKIPVLFFWHCPWNRAFYAPEIECQGAYCLYCHFVLIFNLANNFWTMRPRTLIFYVSILGDKTFLWVPTFLTLWSWPYRFFLFFWKFNNTINFWTVSARALIFHMSNPCDKTRPWVPMLLTCDLGVWPFPCDKTFLGVPTFLPCDLDLGVWHIIWKL